MTARFQRRLGAWGFTAAVIAASAAAMHCAARCPAGESAAPPARAHREREEFGAIVRGDARKKQIALIFTGDARGEGAATILDALKNRKTAAAFFLTGNFLRQQALRPLVARMQAEGHYVGTHSDSHPLYCDWTDRDRSLVAEEFFAADLLKNIADLREFGALPAGKPIYFIPPYEWYNRDQAAWCRNLAGRAGAPVVLVNFTPGAGSNRDYAPEGDAAFVPARQILADILAYELREPRGLRGFMLLLHLGSGRRDPFHPLVGLLCDELKSRGYQLVRVDRLLQ